MSDDGKKMGRTAGGRGNGEGTIRERKDGRHEARITLPDGSRKSVFGKDRAEVVKKLADARRSMDAGQDLSVRREKVGAYLAGWLDQKAASGLRPKTVATYGTIIENHLAPLLGHHYLDALTVAHVQSMYRTMQEGRQGKNPRRPVSARTIGHARAVLRAALNDAMREGRVVRNVAALATPPRVAHKPAAFLTAEQARTLLAATADHPLGPLFTVALMTGARSGELLGLRWPDLDLDAGTATIRQQVQRVKGADGAWTWQFTDTKSATSRRTIALPAPAIAALRMQRERVATMRRAAGARWVEWGLVFPSEVGTPQDGSNVLHRLQAAQRAAGVPVTTFHGLRHSAASLLIASGVPARFVMELLGHSQISLTLNTYAHISPELRRETAAAMERVLG